MRTTIWWALLRQRAVGRRAWIIGSLCSGALQLAAPWLVFGPLFRGHVALFMVVTVLFSAVTATVSAVLTAKRLVDVGLSPILTLFMVMYLCPILYVIGAVIHTFITATVDFWVYAATIPSLVGAVTLATSHGQSVEERVT
jgi:hypothetical protein